MTTTCLLAWAAVLLLLPIVVLLNLTESRQQKVYRWRSYGMTQQAIADRCGVSRTTVRRWLAA
jgi:DNA invertase Pin-like site-specific DNA recombinase